MNPPIFTALSAGFCAMFLSACQPDPANLARERAKERGAQIVADCVATQCETLDLDGTMLEDFSVITGMSHVKILMVSDTNLADLAQVAHLSQLTELHIARTDISDLSALEYFENLEVLHVSSMRYVTDYTPVYAMRGLRELAVDVVTEDGIGYLQDMPGLQRLNLFNGSIPDLAPLARHPGLTDLSINAHLPEDTSALLDIPNLQKLGVESYILDDETLEKLEEQGVELDLYAVIVC